LSRTTWIIIVALMAVGLWTVVVGRGANKELAAYLGMWNGKLSAPDLPTHGMKGYLRIKGSHKAYEMHLEGPQQTIDITGTWMLEKETTIVLTATDIKIGDFGGASKRDPNKPYLDNTLVRAAYGKPLAFNLSPDKETIVSLPITIGEARFSHEFKRTFGNVR
jgi:hypothetical protein